MRTDVIGFCVSAVNLSWLLLSLITFHLIKPSHCEFKDYDNEERHGNRILELDFRTTAPFMGVARDIIVQYSPKAQLGICS